MMRCAQLIGAALVVLQTACGSVAPATPSSPHATFVAGSTAGQSLDPSPAGSGNKCDLPTGRASIDASPPEAYLELAARRYVGTRGINDRWRRTAA